MDSPARVVVWVPDGLLGAAGWYVVYAGDWVECSEEAATWIGRGFSARLRPSAESPRAAGDRRFRPIPRVGDTYSPCDICRLGDEGPVH